MEVSFVVTKSGKTYVDINAEKQVDIDFQGTDWYAELIGADLITPAGEVTTVKDLMWTDDERNSFRITVSPNMKKNPSEGHTVMIMTAEEQEEPLPVTRVGDCYVTQDDQLVVILSENAKQFRISILNHRGQCDVIPWSTMNKTASFVGRSVAAHHCAVGNWEFFRNVEDKWKAAKQ